MHLSLSNEDEAPFSQELSVFTAVAALLIDFSLYICLKHSSSSFVSCKYLPARLSLVAVVGLPTTSNGCQPNAIFSCARFSRTTPGKKNVHRKYIQVQTLSISTLCKSEQKKGTEGRRGIQEIQECTRCAMSPKAQDENEKIFAENFASAYIRRGECWPRASGARGSHRCEEKLYAIKWEPVEIIMKFIICCLYLTRMHNGFGNVCGNVGI